MCLYCHCSFAKVSTTWQKILQEDKWIFQMYSKAVKKVSVSFCACYIFQG